jgi:hypothetical protein
MVGHLDVLDPDGVPRVVDGDEVAPGLRFIGYMPIPAQLRHSGRMARRAAKAIAGDVRARTGAASGGQIAAVGAS